MKNLTNETNETNERNILTNTQKLIVKSTSKFENFGVVKEEEKGTITYSIMMFSNERDGGWNHYLNVLKTFKVNKETINSKQSKEVEFGIIGNLIDVSIENIKEWNQSTQENIDALEEEYNIALEKVQDKKDSIDFFQEEVNEGNEKFAVKLYDAQIELEDLEGEERTLKSDIEKEKESLGALKTSIEIL